VTPQIIAMVPMILRYVTVIPKGIGVAWARLQYAFGPHITSDQLRFDSTRSYQKRPRNSGENAHKFMVSQSDPDNMSFGYGSQVCPGRYFAVGEIKLVLMRQLQEHEFEAPRGKGRPGSIHADENVVLDSYAKVMMTRMRSET
jgi:cytochrome P450